MMNDIKAIYPDILPGETIADQTDVVGALLDGADPTTSSFSIYHLASLD